MAKNIFITFSNTESCFDGAALANDVEKFGVFDEIKAYTENDFSDEYKETVGDRFKILNRGYGYWSWKPYIIRETLKTMEEGDILLYSDAGYGVANNNVELLKEWIDFCNGTDKGILCLSGLGYLEINWTKSDILLYVSEKYDIPISEFLNEDRFQHGAGILMFRKCEDSVKFVDEWFDLCNLHYDLITDKPSEHGNYPQYIENRHDQSAYSLLFKVFKGTNIPNEKSAFCHEAPIRPMSKGHKETYRKYGLNIN